MSLSIRPLLAWLFILLAGVLAGCAAPGYTVDDGRPIDEALLQSIRTFGKGEQVLRPAIVRSGGLNDDECDRQWELPISVTSSQAWNETERVAWVRVLGVDERLTVVARAPDHALQLGDKLVSIDGMQHEKAEKMLAYLAEVRDRGRSFSVQTAAGRQATLVPFQVCRGYTRLSPPNTPVLQDYHWLMSIHPLEVAQADLTEDEALWVVLWTQGVSEEGGARMKVYHYGSNILSSLYTVATIASGLKGAAVAAEAAVAAAQKAAAIAATEVLKQQLINQAKQYATDRMTDQAVRVARNLTQAQIASSMQRLSAHRGMLGGVSRVAATVVARADAWAFARMPRLPANPLAGFSLHQKMLERDLLSNALALDPERLPALQTLADQSGQSQAVLAILKGIRAENLTFDLDEIPPASATADFSYEEPLQVADTTNPFAYGLVEAMLTMPMSSTQP